MAYLLAGILSFLGLMLLAQALRNGDPHKIAQGLRFGAASAFGLLAVFFLVTGRFPAAIPFALLTLLVLQKGLMRRLVGGAGQSRAKTAGGAQSGVETATLRMSLDHRTGSLDGEILQGAWAGKTLSELNLSTVIELRDWAVAHDPASVALIESYLDRTHASWRSRSNSSGTGHNGGYGMTRAKALEILGLEEGASDDAIKAAHRRMMQEAHPDHGGSPEWAAELNAAKDCLLGR